MVVRTWGVWSVCVWNQEVDIRQEVGQAVKHSGPLPMTLLHPSQMGSKCSNIDVNEWPFIFKLQQVKSCLQHLETEDVGEPKHIAAAEKLHRAQGLIHGVLLQHWGIAWALQLHPHLGASSQQAPKKSRIPPLVHKVGEMSYGRRVICGLRDHSTKKQKSQEI